MQESSKMIWLDFFATFGISAFFWLISIPFLVNDPHAAVRVVALAGYIVMIVDALRARKDARLKKNRDPIAAFFAAVMGWVVAFSVGVIIFSLAGFLNFNC